MKYTYTISEIADFFNLSTQTLRYYDKIGLLTPETKDASSKYRLYSSEQFNKLYLIRDLKHLGLSLEQIKNYCETKDVRTLSSILAQISGDLEVRIKELEETKKHVDEYVSSLRLLEHVNERGIFEFRQIRERFAYVIPINFQAGNLPFYIEMLQDSLAHSQLKSVEPGHVMLGIRKEYLEQKNIRIYNDIGHLLKQPAEHRNVKRFPEGLYAVACHLGPYDHIFDTYRRLIRFIRQNRYQIAGDSLEISITDMAFTDKPEEYVTEIQIPVTELPRTL